jgi:hypothetical protein
VAIHGAAVLQSHNVCLRLKNLNRNSETPRFPGASLAYFDVHFISASAVLSWIIHASLAIHRNLHSRASRRLVGELAPAPSVS